MADTTPDTEAPAAHPDFSAIQDGIEHLDNAGAMSWSADAIRVLDAQNEARGREIDDLEAKLASATRTVVKLGASCDRWRGAFEMLHARLLRDLPGDASELPPPDDGYWARSLDELLTFAAQLAHETETGARTIPDDTDNERA